jgi:hypothetical protein
MTAPTRRAMSEMQDSFQELQDLLESIVIFTTSDTAVGICAGKALTVLCEIRAALAPTHPGIDEALAEWQLAQDVR